MVSPAKYASLVILTHRHYSLDITGDGFGEGSDFYAFNPEYAEKVMAPWLTCCQRTVGSTSALLTSILFSNLVVVENVLSNKEVAKFTFNEAGCPILPVVDVNNTVPDALRNLLIDYLDAQWGMSLAN